MNLENFEPVTAEAEGKEEVVESSSQLRLLLVGLSNGWAHRTRLW